MKIEISLKINDDRIILYNPEKFCKKTELEKYCRNVIRTKCNGELVWRIDTPIVEGNAYGDCVDTIHHIELVNEELLAYAFYGNIYSVNIENGHAVFLRHDRW